MIEPAKNASVFDTDRSGDTKSGAYLEETFYILSKKNVIFRVRLTNRGLCLRKESSDSTKEQIISISDIIGSRCMRSKRRVPGAASCVCSSFPGPQPLKVVEENSGESDESDTSAYLYIYTYVLKRNRKGGKRERTTITLRFRSFDKYDDNNREAQKWRTAIKCLLRNEPVSNVAPKSDDRKLLILLNPKSGPGKGRELFQRRVAPVLQEAEIPYDLHVTKYAQYAREFVRTRNIYCWRGILAIGGDGIFFEVLNGFFERLDWMQVLNEIPIGIIPCGSGNGLARTICYLYDEPYTPNPILSCTLAACKGKIELMDIIRVETRTKIMFSFLSVGWGLISDIDIESESLRAIGGQRFAIWVIARLIGLRTYKGVVSYMPASKTNTTQPSKQSSKMSHSISQDGALDADFEKYDDCEATAEDVVALDLNSEVIQRRQRVDSWYSATSRRSAYFSSAGSDYQSVVSGHELRSPKEAPRVYGPASRLPALTAVVPPQWTRIEGDFVLVHASYQTHLGEDAFFAPQSKLSDGVMWLMIIKSGVSRGQLLAFLLGLSSGVHAETTNEHIQFIPVTAFRIEPKGNAGYITVDGELVEYGPIQAEVFPSMAKIMVPNNKS